MDELTETETAVLTFERQRWAYLGAKETAVRGRFGWSLTRHNQIVAALLEKPAALAADPMTVRRLIRLRNERRAARSVGHPMGQRAAR